MVYHVPRRFARSQADDADVFPSLQIRPLPIVAGKQQDLPVPALGEQIIQRREEPVVVEGHQRVIEDKGDVLLRGQYHVADGEAHRQIQLVGSALAELLDAAAHGVAGGLRGEGQVAAQQYLVVFPCGERGEDLRRPCAQCGRKAVLQGGVGLLQRRHSQRDGIVFLLEPSQLLLLLR